MPEEDGTKTFTQAEVDAVAAAARKREREGLASKYADYDDLKKAADAAKGQETALEKMQKQLSDLTERNTKLDREATIREVADDLKISIKQARRLQGATKEELLADGREFLEEFKPATGGKPIEGSNEGEGSEGEGESSAAETDSAPASTGKGRARRPVEELSSGAPVTGGKAEETNPHKLAAMIPR